MGTHSLDGLVLNTITVVSNNAREHTKLETTLRNMLERFKVAYNGLPLPILSFRIVHGSCHKQSTSGHVSAISFYLQLLTGTERASLQPPASTLCGNFKFNVQLFHPCGENLTSEFGRWASPFITS